MKLIVSALRHPITVLVAVMGIAFFSYLSIRNSKIDIFPTLGLPTVYVAQPYGGLSPEQMEGFVTSYYEYHFLYITGVKYVDSKSIQGAAIIKIEFNEGTDKAQAMAGEDAIVVLVRTPKLRCGAGQPVKARDGFRFAR